MTGGYDERLKENREYLLELKHVCEEKGIVDNVVFSPSCSTEERNEFLSSCLCLIYTPTVIVPKCLRYCAQSYTHQCKSECDKSKKFNHFVLFYLVNELSNYIEKNVIFMFKFTG